MKIKLVAFRFVIALLAFFLGISFFGGWGLMQNKSLSPKLEIAETIENKEPIIITTVENPSETETFEEEKPNFEEGGYYYIIGKTPKAFADFTEFHIELWDYDEKKDEIFMVPPSGYVDTKQTFKFKRVFLGKQDISFETENVHGISYQFSGKLVDKVYVFEEDRVFLEGTLKKLKDGKKIAEGKFKFSWYVGGC